MAEAKMDLKIHFFDERGNPIVAYEHLIEQNRFLRAKVFRLERDLKLTKRRADNARSARTQMK